MYLLSIIYYFGIVACGIQGSQKSSQLHKIFCPPISFFAAMGGGIIRDLFLLYVFPAAFTTGCILDVMIALCAGIVYRFLLQKHIVPKIFENYVILTDALGVGTFIAMGVNKALICGANQIIVFCCGIVTALGGGILSSLLCFQSIRKVLTANISYRIITILGTILYMYYLAIGVNPTVAQYLLILYTFSAISITNYNYRKMLIGHLTKFLKHAKAMVFPIPKAAILYRQNNYIIHTSNRLAYSYVFCSSNYTRNKNLPYVDYTYILRDFKLRCPRRFARGR